jgi:hypothetical protein
VEIEDRLNALESRYRTTLSATAAAKAHYLALLDEPNATPESRKRARRRWENLESRKQSIAARMGEVEDFADRAVG